MIIAALILGLIIIGLIVLIIYLSGRSNGNFDGAFYFGICFTIVCILEIDIINDITNTPKPTAMDVYQGKTTLEYTIRDGIKVDSVVVWKRGIENEN